MQTFILLWLLTLFCSFGSLQCSKCPAFCVCYMWQNLLRIDCVSQGLLNVNIGLDNGDRTEVEIGGTARPIQVLDLSHNSISSLNGGSFNYDNWARLEALHLSHNSIVHIYASALQGLVHLKILDLSYNRLRRNQEVSPGSIAPQSALLLAQLFKDLPNLRALRLGSNPLENEDFYGKTNIQDGEPLLAAPKLEFLDLGSCHLGHVGPKSFIGLDSLKMLNLSDNQLISLSPSAFDNMKNLEELSLHANPWPCDQTGDIQILENWLASKKFQPVCPAKKFEKIVESNPNPHGPKKAKDDLALLYYYQLLGIRVEEEDSPPKIHHSDANYLDDVEVFDNKAVNSHQNPLEELSKIYHINCSNEPDVIYKEPNEIFHCSVIGIPFLWFVLFSFLAGFLVSFFCTFLYFAEPCSIKGYCSQILAMIRRSSSSASRRRYFNQMKSLRRGENFTSLMESDSAQGCGDTFSLIDENGDDFQSMGLTTPVMPRAAASLTRTETPPPTYSEHLALHAIRTDP